MAVATRLTPATGSPSPFLGKTNANGHMPAYSTVATVSTRPGRRRVGRSPGARAGSDGWAAVGPAGRSAVMAASSAQVRDASAWPTAGRIRPWPAVRARRRPSGCRSPAHGRRGTPGDRRCPQLPASGLTALTLPAPTEPRYGKNSRPPVRKVASDLQIRRFLCGFPDQFRSVRDLGRVPSCCSFESEAPEGCSSAWLPAWLPWRARPGPGAGHPRL